MIDYPMGRSKQTLLARGLLRIAIEVSSILFPVAFGSVLIVHGQYGSPSPSPMPGSGGSSSQPQPSYDPFWLTVGLAAVAVVVVLVIVLVARSRFKRT